MKKIILVTGAAGFIGSHICDLLIKKNYSVIGVDNLKRGSRKNLNKELIFENINLNNIKSVDNLLRKYNPQQIIHHASNLVDVNLSVKYPDRAYKDVIMTVNLLNTAFKYGLEHFIFSSSANVYGNPKSLPIEENVELQPSSPYGLAKESIENFIKYFYKKTGVTYTIFRYFNVYGERQANTSAVIPTFLEKLKSEKPITLHGGDQTRDFIYVKDVALVNYIATIKKPLGTFNIGSGKPTSINKLLKIISKMMRKESKIVFVKKSTEDINASQASIEKAWRQLLWKPSTTLENGIMQIIRYNKLRK